MWNFLAAASEGAKPEQFITIPDSLLVAAIGIVTVFVGLAVIVGLLYLFSFIFKVDLLGKIAGLFKRKKKSEPVVAETGLSDEEQAELTAVITAAICACQTEESDVVPPFVIRSVKRR